MTNRCDRLDDWIKFTSSDEFIQGAQDRGVSEDDAWDKYSTRKGHITREEFHGTWLYWRSYAGKAMRA